MEVFESFLPEPSDEKENEIHYSNLWHWFITPIKRRVWAQDWLPSKTKSLMFRSIARLEFFGGSGINEFEAHDIYGDHGIYNFFGNDFESTRFGINEFGHYGICEGTMVFASDYDTINSGIQKNFIKYIGRTNYEVKCKERVKYTTKWGKLTAFLECIERNELEKGSRYSQIYHFNTKHSV